MRSGLPARDRPLDRAPALLRGAQGLGGDHPADRPRGDRERPRQRREAPRRARDEHAQLRELIPAPEGPRGWGPVPDLLRRGGGGAPGKQNLRPRRCDIVPRRGECEVRPREVQVHHRGEVVESLRRPLPGRIDEIGVLLGSDVDALLNGDDPLLGGSFRPIRKPALSRWRRPPARTRSRPRPRCHRGRSARSRAALRPAPWPARPAPRWAGNRAASERPARRRSAGSWRRRGRTDSADRRLRARGPRWRETPRPMSGNTSIARARPALGAR